MFFDIMNSGDPQEWRDLIWALNSPSLLADGHCSLATEEAADPGRIDPDEVVSFIRQQPTRRVGRYFERLLYFYLSRIRRADIIASGLQIRDDSRTLGELDFVFQNRYSPGLDRHSGSLLTHWETAVKFYLWCPDRTVEGSHLIGPNAADTFERKVTRLLQHQLPLGQTTRTAEELRNARDALDSSPETVDVEKPKSQAFVKGRIFYPAEFGQSHGSHTECSHPDQLSSAHLRGVWLKESQLDLFEEFPADRFAFVEKPYWLAPPERFELSAVTVIDRLRSHFQQSRYPQLLACCRRPAASGEDEAQHVFVMPNEWPVPAAV